MAAVPGGDVYFGNLDLDKVDWRAECELTDGDPDEPLTPAEHKTLVEVLGFDPDEEPDDPAPE
jgi:hypothetical protein